MNDDRQDEQRAAALWSQWSPADQRVVRMMSDRLMLEFQRTGKVDLEGEVTEFGRFRLGGQPLDRGEVVQLIGAIATVLQQVPTVEAVVMTVAHFLNQLSGIRRTLRDAPRFSLFLRTDAERFTAPPVQSFDVAPGVAYELGERRQKPGATFILETVDDVMPARPRLPR